MTDAEKKILVFILIFLAVLIVIGIVKEVCSWVSELTET